MRIILTTLFVLLLLIPTVEAQDRQNAATANRKQATAVRVADGSIRVDGRLDDEAWRQAIPITDFVQKEPNEGGSPTEDMEIRIVYDDSAVYVGARMFNRHGPIQAPMGRRDGVVDQAEYVMVSLDTFQDRLTAYGFGVTATGVRIDRFYPKDDETTFDDGFDPVWEARTHIEEQGWTAELWIPFSQLRFNDRPEQVWGLNVQRSTPSINEMDYWAPVPRTQKIWVSRFGDLRGIQGTRPSKRIEVLPYPGSSSIVNGNRDPGNPFDDGRNLAGKTGADLKMGLGPSLTLEATLNPDFGEVEADPAEVNLTAIETTFTEKRPFFTEGSRLLNTSLVNNFFYSRRIGAAPGTSVTGDYVDYPRTSTILGAAKLTGRLQSGTSLGLLAAVTDEESADVSNRGSSLINTTRVAPRTGFALMRVLQEFGPSASTVSGMVSMVHRNLASGDPLAALMDRNAFSASSDSVLRFKRGEYELRSYGGFTYLTGESTAIARMQRSAVHYFQRPDKDYSLYDPTRIVLNGYKGGTTFERTGGRHWLWDVSTDFESPGFESNDIGRVSATDGRKINASLTYRETTPGRIFRNYSVGLAQNNEWDYGGDRQGGNVQGNVTLTFLNFWAATFQSGPDMATLDWHLTRGGPLMATPKGWTTSASLRNRNGAKTLWNANVTNATDVASGQRLNVRGGFSFRPGTRWQLSMTPNYIRQTDSQQYVTTVGGGRAETYGQRYIFSHIDRTTWSTQFRMGFTLKPDVNVDVYGEPFAASGRYYDFGELSAPSARQLREYGTDGTTISRQLDGSQIVTDGAATFPLKNSDFNVRSFRSNVVLRWEWRPGSILYLVWQQNRRAQEAIADSVDLGDMFRSVRAPGSNFFAVKMSFWLPVK